MPNELSDEQLIKGIKRGSIEDFQAFYERYFPYVYKLVLSLLKNETDTLDVCQDLFIEYYQKANTYHRDRGSVKAWISVRAKSRAIDYIRKKNRVVLKDQMIFSDTKEVPTQSVEETVLSKIERERLLEKLDMLPPLQREAIYLNYKLSMSHKETAEALGRPLGTIKSLIRYGLKNLRKSYITSNELKRGDQRDT